MALVLGNKKSDTVFREYEGVTFQIGRNNSPAWKQRIKTATKRKDPLRGNFDKLSTDDQDAVIAEAAFGTVLVGWSGMVVDGKDIPFNEANCIDLLTSDPDANNFIFSVASDVDEFKQAAKEALVKKASDCIDWQLRHAKNSANNFYSAVAARTGKVIKAPEEPEIDDDIVELLTAFNRLSSGRNTGFGLCSLVFSEVTNYFEKIPLVIDCIDVFVDCIQAMDGVFLTYHAEQEKGKNGT